MKVVQMLRRAIELLSEKSLSGLDRLEAWLEERRASESRPQKFYVVRRAVSWEESCRQIAETHGLSPRETEVLQLLSVGRDAKRISEILVISTSTAKSHMYSIYKKLGVSSQQSLIDLIEGSDAEKALQVAV